MSQQENKEYNPFKLNTKQALALGAIGYQDSYGLQIRAEIEEVTNGRMKMAMGSLYPILHFLEEEGLIESYWGEKTDEKRRGARRRYYKLTGVGRRALNELQSVQARWALTPVGG